VSNWVKIFEQGSPTIPKSDDGGQQSGKPVLTIEDFP